MKEEYNEKIYYIFTWFDFIIKYGRLCKERRKQGGGRQPENLF